jgi:Putative esterase
MSPARVFLCTFGFQILAVVGLGQDTRHLFFRVTLGPQFSTPVSGRLLLFLETGNGAKEIDENPFRPTGVYVAAKELAGFNPGSSVEIDTDELAFPAGFSSLKPGDYQVQAVLDVGHTYSYSGRGAGDLLSEVVALPGYTPGEGREPGLILTATVPERPAISNFPPGFDQSRHLEDFVSPALSAFFGTPIHMRAWVITPPDYDVNKTLRYPTVYWTHGFTGRLLTAESFGATVFDRMKRGRIPPMIWVMLDESWTTGTHEFADSVNNGPWGKALTSELIPALERKYRMDARARGRFLQGHSSGGWATLQLQVNYPKMFGGTWSTSPDPSDFHDFSGVDLYAENANLYRRPDGSPYPLVRDHGTVVATAEVFARDEQVLGDYGGQFASFEWVFSPRGPTGKPLAMFDRATGDVNPSVVAYWRDHYDLAHIVSSTWSERGMYLRGKIHVFVGTADTFYLDQAAHRFEKVLFGLHADPHFTFLDGRTHFDLYRTHAGTPGEKNDPWGLLDQIAAEMYAVARPAAQGRASGTGPAH